MSFAFLRAIDADGELAIDRLTLPGGRRLDRVHARLTLRDARLDVPSLTMAAFGGSVQSVLQIDGTREERPAIRVKVDATGLDLTALLEFAGIAREVRGGKTDVTLDLALHGVSPRQWASGANGSFTASVGPAALAKAKAAPDSAFNSLADLVNPFRSIDATTELQCAVIRLPLADGIARVDRSIAMETKKVGVSASGTLDFRNETLDLALKPRLKEGVAIKVLQLASLVRVRGPFAAPVRRRRRRRFGAERRAHRRRVRQRRAVGPRRDDVLRLDREGRRVRGRARARAGSRRRQAGSSSVAASLT